MKKRVFVKNTAILTASSLLLKGAGMFFRVYISNKIGSEGMGLYQLIFSVYTLGCAFASSGIGTATTKIISENYMSLGADGAKKIVRTAFFAAALFSGAASAAMFFLSDTAALLWISDERGADSLKILSFALPFIAMSSVLKGYFTARRKSLVAASSQIFEQTLRIGVVMLLLGMTRESDVRYGCAAVAVGNVISEAASLLWVYVSYRLDLKKMKEKGKTKRYFKRLFTVFAPTAVSQYVNTALHTFENITVPKALDRYTKNSAVSLSQFGTLKGMAIPVLFFPSSFLAAVSSLLIPEISEIHAAKNKAAIKRAVLGILRFTSVSSFFTGAVFFCFSDQIAMLLYKNAEVGYYIKFLAPIIPFMYTESICQGVLQGLDRQSAMMRYNMVNSVLRISAVMIFVPMLGMDAFLYVMALSNVFTCTMCVRKLIKSACVKFEAGKLFLSPLSASVCACTVTNVVPIGENGIFCIILRAAFLFAAFLVFSVLCGAIRIDDAVIVKNFANRKKNS